MDNLQIPAGTRIYLTKKGKAKLCIQPDKTLINDILYVAYDVKINGIIIIRKNTRVMGDWITESNPTVAAQLQVSKIFLNGDIFDINADSDVIEEITDFNDDEVSGANFLYDHKPYRSSSNINKRMAKINSKNRVFNNNNRNLIFVQINTKEIRTTLFKDFDPYGRQRERNNERNKANGFNGNIELDELNDINELDRDEENN